MFQDKSKVVPQNNEPVAIATKTTPTTSEPVKAKQSDRFTLISKLKSKLTGSKYTTLAYYRNNPLFIVFAIGYLLLSLLFVLIQLLVLYPTAEWSVKMARFGGILLNFNSCLIIMLVLRRVNSWLKLLLKSSHFAFLDDSIEYHKMLGIFIFLLSILHTLGQCINYCKFSSIFCLFLKCYFSSCSCVVSSSRILSSNQKNLLLF